MNKPSGYSRLQIRLHWVIALLIILQVVFADNISQAWRAVRDGQVPNLNFFVASHVFFGIAVLLLAAWRLRLRMTRGVPAAPAGRQAVVLAGEVAHWALYALMVIVPLSGMAAWFGGIEAAAEVHEVTKTILMILVILHVLAALYHQFFLKDGLLLRMKRPQD